MENLSKKPFQCEICKSYYANKSKFDMHISRVHEVKKCYLCEYTSSKKSDLEKHISSFHEGNKYKPYKCNMCEYTCSKNSNLKRHVESVHKGLVFSCTFCGISYASKWRLKKHISKRHEANPDVSNITKSELTLSNDVSVVLAENTKNQSVSIHEVKKTFQCSMCDKTYDVPSGLT